MRCPKCGNLDDKVIDSRLSRDGSSIRRRRECLNCEFRFTTYEQVEKTDLRVVKRDGRGEPFDRNKLLSGVLKACEKRPISIETQERLAEEIVAELETNHGREVPSRIVGALVMEKLRQLDEVAYVRYASVYRHFRDVGEFIEEIQELEKRPKVSPAQQDLFA
jgi:transcriptional repressor NrdR